MNTFRRLALLALSLLSVACAASSGQRVPFPDQKVAVTDASVARIYFVRDDSLVLQKRPVRIFDGDKEIGSLSRDTYLCWERPAGRSLGRAQYESVDPGRGKLEGLVDLNCAGGNVYYFNIRVAREDGQPKIETLLADDGKRLVAERRPAKTL